jgi:hypothetical protein
MCSFCATVNDTRETVVTEEVNIPWLRRYLTHEAVVHYHSWDVRDSVWAIFSYFCWKIRSAEEFEAAHRDLCAVAQISEDETQLWSVVQEGRREMDKCGLIVDSGDAASVEAGEDSADNDGHLAVSRLTDV